jgi:hypothetical protein
MPPTILSRRYAPAASVQSVVLPQAFGLPAIVAGWTWCATSTASVAAASTATKTMHSPTHRRLRQALRRQRCTARPLFTRPAWPRRALRSQDYQRAPRKLNAPPTILYRRYAPAASVQSSYLTLLGCKLLSQGRPSVRQARHQRRRQALRRQHGISGVGSHCDDNEAQPDASTAATSTSNTAMHNPTAFHTTGVTATCSDALRSHDYQRALRKLSVHAAAFPLPSLSLPANF